MKPIWPESGGVPPQHRQLADQYGEFLVASSFGAVAPDAWGVSALEVVQDGVGLRVSKLQVRFASGMCAFLGPGDSLVREIPWRAQKTFLVAVGLAEHQMAAPNVADDVSVAAVRYLRAGERLRPNLRLLIADEGADSYERIPIARVVDGALDPSFSPPLLRVLPGTPIARGIQSVRDALSARQGELLRARDARPLDLEAFVPTQAPQLLALSAIQETLAVLGSGLAPRSLYGALTELLGALDVLAGGPSSLPTYAHEGPAPSFEELFARLLKRVPTVARDPHRAFALERRDPSTFALTLSEPSIFERRVYLVASGADERTLATHLPIHAKVASAAWLPSVVQQAIQGVPIATEFDVPPSLPSSANHCCFRVDTRSELWRDIVDQRSLMVHVPNAPRDLALTVFVFPPSSLPD